MNTTSPQDVSLEQSSLNLQTFLFLMFAATLGMVFAVLLLPTWLPNLAFSLTGEAPKLYWYLSRGTAFTALSLLWISMALGIGLSNRLARSWPGTPAAFAIHEYVSLLGLAFAAFHALVILGDQFMKFDLLQLLVPFTTSDYRPLWVGIGQIGFYLWLIVALSFYVRKSIGQKTWRWIHYASYSMYILALLHGIYSGSDSSADWSQWYYWISAAGLLFLTLTRLIESISEKLFPARRHVPAPLPVAKD